METVYEIYWLKYTPPNEKNTVYDVYWPKYNPPTKEQTIYDICWPKYHPPEETVYDKLWPLYHHPVNQEKIEKQEGEVELHELRNTPGFTNYTYGVEKDLAGNVSSSAELKRYYSTLDAEVYFNGHWVEDIEQIQWNISQQTMPLFGYNSYLWDEVAQGTRIISGAFTVLFTKPQPLYEYVDINGKKSIVAGTKVDNFENIYGDGSGRQGTQGTLKSIKLARNDNSRLLVNNEHASIWGKRFDIDVVCGEYDDIGGYPVHIILKDCCLTSSATIRDKNGEPAAEAYQFMAREFKTIQ